MKKTLFDKKHTFAYVLTQLENQEVEEGQQFNLTGQVLSASEIEVLRDRVADENTPEQVEVIVMHAKTGEREVLNASVLKCSLASIQPEIKNTKNCF